MSKYTFAPSSIRYLGQVHPLLRQVMAEVKARANIDFDISCGYRPIYKQKELYDAGRSQLDGVHHKSYHNYKPSRAVDIYAYKGKYADYDMDKLTYLTDLAKQAAEEIGIKITCGIDWPDFVDGPHIQLELS